MERAFPIPALNPVARRCPGATPQEGSISDTYPEGALARIVPQ